MDERPTNRTGDVEAAKEDTIMQIEVKGIPVGALVPLRGPCRTFS